MPRPPLPLPYRQDSAALFDAFARRPWSIFLDSGHPFDPRGRFDFIAAEPTATLWQRDAMAWIDQGAGVRPEALAPLDAVRRLMPRPGPAAGPDFRGGLLGYFGYDLAPQIDARLPAPADPEPSAWPDMALGLYPWLLRVDHHKRQTQLLDSGIAAIPEPQWQRLIQVFSRPTPRPPPAPLRGVGPVQSPLERPAYARAFARIQRYLRAGDCYQVNLARGFRQQTAGDAWSGYLRLRRRRPAPFGAFFATPWGEVLSNSPERFLQVRAGRVLTSPIKGTRPRGADPQHDRALAQELLASAKDRAENLMITDLLRNDLGKVCAPGSIRAEAFCALESFPTVHHLVSRISGRLRPENDALSLLAGAFPGGSITGAPKRRAMEIIAELEPEARTLYCGAIGYLGLNGDMDLNIAIRTLTHAHGEARYWAGGGIVMDSDCDQEFEETQHKARAFSELLQG